jgi:hypothetical protein
MKTVTIKCKEGDIQVPALFPVPGLAVHRSYQGVEDSGARRLGDSYNVSHILSGLCIGDNFRKRGQAVAYAKRVAQYYPVTEDDRTLLNAIRNRTSEPTPRELYAECVK